MVFCVPGIISAKEKNKEHKNSILTDIVVFMCDVLFFILAACVSAVFIFHVNNGNIRGIALTGSLVGFIIYYNSVGRLVTLVSTFIIKGIYFIIRFILKRVLLPLLNSICRFFTFALRSFCKLDSYLFTKRTVRRMILSAKRGFR